MKAYFLKYIVSSLGIIIMSCSSGEGPEPQEPQNNAPTVPSLVYPTNNLLCIDNTLEFEWNAATDSNGDAIKYEIHVSKDNQFSQIAHIITTSLTKHTVTLEKGLAYYWRVKAIDSKNAASNFTSIFNLYTESEGITNHLPFAPELVKPTSGNTVEGSEVTLEWTGSDTDNDPLTYDVYFDTVNPPTTKVGDNQSETTKTQSIATNTTYYWKIIVKDDKSAETIGQVWNFKSQ